MFELYDKRVSKKHLDAAFINDTKKHGKHFKYFFSKAVVCSQPKVATTLWINSPLNPLSCSFYFLLIMYGSMDIDKIAIKIKDNA